MHNSDKIENIWEKFSCLYVYVCVSHGKDKANVMHEKFVWYLCLWSMNEIGMPLYARRTQETGVLFVLPPCKRRDWCYAMEIGVLFCVWSLVMCLWADDTVPTRMTGWWDTIIRRLTSWTCNGLNTGPSLLSVPLFVSVAAFLSVSFFLALSLYFFCPSLYIKYLHF